MLLKCFDEMFLPALLAFSPCLTSNASLVMFVLRAVYTIKLKRFDEPMICIVWYFSPQGMIHIYIRPNSAQENPRGQSMYIYIVFWYMCVLHGVASFYIISMLHHFATEILTGALKSPFHFQTCPVWNTLMIINACLNGSPVVTSNSSLQDVFVGRKLLGGKCGILTFRNGPFQAQDSWKEDWCCRGLSDVMVGIPQSNYHGCDHF